MSASKRKILKICAVCNKEYYSARETSKTCTTECSKAYHKKWAQRNREAARLIDRKFKNENRDLINEKRRERRKALSWEEKYLVNKEVYKKNKDKVKKRYKEWSLKNKQYRSFLNQKVKRNNINVPKDDKCCYCDATQKLTLDHLVPLSEGGGDLEHNIVTACLSCNSSKKNHDFIRWYRIQPFYNPIKELNILLNFLAG